MKKRKIFKYLFLLCFFGLVVAVVAVGCVFISCSSNLPKHMELEDYQPPITSRVYSSNGILLREYAEERRLFTSVENIPDIIKYAFISAEDKNFYNHRGLDPEALLSAMLYNIVAYVKKQQFRGGSTITQQVVKNMLLTKERTIKRKMKEAILAIRITRDFEKDKILELYLNHIFLGNNSYGVASAALEYFNKSLDEITIAEAAVLASLPKAPGKLNPIVNYKASMNRRNWVLKRMVINGYITKEQMLVAQNEEINIKVRKKDEYFNYGAFVEEVRKKLLTIYEEDALMKNGLVVSSTIEPNMQKSLDKAFKDGLENYDERHGYRGALGNIGINNENLLNNWAQKLQDFGIRGYYRNSWNRAVVLDFDDKNNRVIIGLLNKDNADLHSFDEAVKVGEINAKKSYLSLNNIKWAVDPQLLDTISEYSAKSVVDVNLKVGDVIFVESTVKDGYLVKQVPQVNGGAVILNPHNGRILAMVGGYIDSEMNFNRATQAKRQPGSSIKPFIYLSAFENGYSPADTIMDEEIVLPQGLGTPSYRPKNFSDSYHGLVTLRTALQNSYNVSTVRLSSQIGLNNVAEVIKRFGINKRPKKVYSVALGSLESHLVSMVKAYAIIVNGGKYIDLEPIEKIQDKYGKTIFRRDNRNCKKCIVQEENIQNVEVPFLEDNRKKITDGSSAYQITSILEGVVNYGTAWRAKAIGKTIGGKTGTSNDFRDAWFIGFTPDLVLGVYVGYDDNRSLGENETGAKTALPIFINTMKEILKSKPSVPFRVPENIVLRRIDVTTGKSPTLISHEKNIIMEAFRVRENGEINSGNRNNTNPFSEFDVRKDEDNAEEDDIDILNMKGTRGESTDISGIEKVGEGDNCENCEEKAKDSIFGDEEDDTTAGNFSDLVF
ncbi:MAG: PBP1A family penicillin-binding protein [Rickettsiales bacterium]|jgi:penicillin-binding protein 1A|nr:PBP1A family penicillin-binding protein [Rickettsiales bacterium]